MHHSEFDLDYKTGDGSRQEVVGRGGAERDGADQSTDYVNSAHPKRDRGNKASKADFVALPLSRAETETTVVVYSRPRRGHGRV